jgi:hypothetical protein
LRQIVAGWRQKKAWHGLKFELGVGRLGSGTGRGKGLRVQAFEESIQEASQYHQASAALPGEMDEVGKNLGATGQLAKDLRNLHLPMSIHGRLKIAGHGHFRRVENHAQGEGGNAAG